MVDLPGSAPGPAHQVPQDGPLYRIGDGIHRSLAARQMGHSEIQAIELTRDGATANLGRIPLTRLFVDVNKASIPMDDRWQRALEEVGRGQAHPIEVTGITPEKAKLLLPLSLVKMKRL